MFMDVNKIIIGVILLGSSLLLANLLLQECTQKERIVAGALIGAANGAFIGGAVVVPGGVIAGAAIGAAIGGKAGETYDSSRKDAKNATKK